MIEDYTLLVKAIQRITKRSKSSDPFVLKDSGLFVDIKSNNFNGRDFVLRLDDRSKFIFSGDVKSLINNVSCIINLYLEGSKNVGRDTSSQLIALLLELENKVSELDYFPVNSWSLEITKNFVKLYNDRVTNETSETNAENNFILKNEAESWISQVKNLLNISRNGERTSFIDDKSFWNVYLSNLSGLETFFNSKIFLFLESELKKTNELILGSSLEVLKKLDKYYHLCNIFIEFYFGIDVESFHATKDLNKFANGCINLVEYINKEIQKYPRIVKIHISRLLNYHYTYMLNTLRENSLLENSSRIKNLIKFTLKRFDSINLRLNDGKLLDKKNMIVYNNNKDEFLSSLKIIEDLECLNDAKLVFNNFRKYCDEEFLVNDLNANILKAERCILNKWENIDENNTQTFESICLRNIIDFFSYLSSSNCKLDINELYTNLKDEMKRKLIDNNIETSNIDVDDIIGLNTVIDIEEKYFQELSLIVIYFSSFQKFKSFSEKTIRIRSKLTGHLDTCIAKIIEHLEFENFNIQKDFIKIISILKYIEIKKYHSFQDNCKNVIMLDKINSRIRNLFEELETQFNNELEKSYNYIKKMDIFERKILFVLSDSLEVLDLSNVFNVCEIFNSFEVFIESCSIDYIELLRKVYSRNDILLQPELNAPEDTFFTLNALLKRLTGSYFYKILRNEVKIVMESRIKYNRFKKEIEAFKNIILQLNDDIGIFNTFIDEIFEVCKKIFNLKFKYLIVNDYEIELTEKIRRLQKAYFDFILLTYKIKQNDQINFFNGSKSINFSFDSSSYVRKIKNVEHIFVKRAIDRSFKYILKQYLLNVISILKKGDRDFFTVRCLIETDKKPELFKVFNIFEKIFPSQNSKFFFENVQQKIQIDDEIKFLITLIIKTVASVYAYTHDQLEILYSPKCNANLIKSYEHIIKKKEIIRKIKFNEFLFYEFTYVEKGNDINLDSILQNIKRELFLCLKKVNKKIDVEYKNDFDRKGYNTFNIDNLKLEYLETMEIEEKIKLQGKLLKMNKYLSKKFKKIKKYKEILEENNIYTDDKSYISLVKYFEKMSFLSNSIKRCIKSRNRECNKDEYDKIRNKIVNDLNIIENDLLEIKNLKDADDAIKKVEAIERDLSSIFEIVEYLNLILGVTNKDLVEVKIGQLFADIKTRVDGHKKMMESWTNFINTSFNFLNLNELKSFYDYFENFTPALNLEKAFVAKINSYKELSLSLHLVFQSYVTQEYFDKNMKLEDCFSKFTSDSLKKLVLMAENDFKVKSSLENITDTLNSLYYIFNDYIINFDEIENKLYNLLADSNILQSYNKNEKYSSKLSNINSMIYTFININKEIRDVQDGINDFNNIFTGEVFRKEKVVYDKIRKEYVNFVLKNSVKNNNFDETFENPRPCDGLRKLSLSSVYKDKNVIFNLKENIANMNIVVKKTINNYRESIVRFLFVSDSDIINLLCGRSQYNDMIKQIYNIDDVLIEEENVIGIQSCEERFYFKIPISLKLPINEFFTMFDATLKEELVKYTYFQLITKYQDLLKQDKSINLDLFKDIEVLSPLPNSKNLSCSVIDDVLNELYYFNGLPYNKSIKIDFVEEYRKQNGDDFLIFYPKPVLYKKEILISDISTRKFDYEYYPPSDIIFTKLTSIIFSSISLGLNKSSGIILFGNSGTGKTETVKYYCKSVGKQVIVFCCSDDCDLKSLENIIIGCKKLGSYLCLDEFNRLNEKTMSSITEVIYKYKDSVKFFLTMNLGYTGRNQLPRTLSSIFSEVRVDTPDLQDIISIYFKSYSSNLMSLLNRLFEICEPHRHYNFGLRAMRTILRNIKIFTEKNHQIQEEMITLNSIYNYYYSSLSNSDKLKLNELFFEIFHVNIDLNMSYKDMLLFGLQNSRGILLYGDNQSGKSFLIKNSLVSNYKKIFYFNPYNVQYFFGTYDNTSGDWIDSEFVSVLRSNRNKKVVFIFDTIMDSKWIENLNSALDDTSSLCLKSGEVIKLSSDVKFIFEADNIDKLTPATLTRLTTIFVEGNYTLNQQFDIVYKDGQFKSSELLQTRQQCFYENKIKEILKTNNLLFLKGECGKKSLVKRSLTEFNIVFLSAVEMKDKFVRNFFHENEIIIVKNQKVCISKIILYIDQFEFSNDSLIESIREFSEHRKIGDVIFRYLKIICAYDVDVHHKRLKDKVHVLSIDREKEIEFYIRHELKQGGIFDSDVSNVVSILCILKEKSLVEYKNLKKIIQIFIKAYKLCLNPRDLLYYIVSIFTYHDSRHIIEEFYGESVNVLCFNYESTFYVDKYVSKICLSSVIRFLLFIEQSFVIEGPPLSGKRYLLNQCLENYQNQVNVVNFYENKEIEKLSVFLINDHKKLPKKVLKRCVVLNISRPELFCINIEKFMKYNALNEPIFNLDVIKELTEFAIFRDRQKDVTYNEISCECCTLGLKRYSLNLETRYNTSNEAFSEYYWNDKLNEEKSKDLGLFVKYDLMHKTNGREPSYLVFDNLYKFIDFYKTYLEVLKELDKKYEERKKFIEDGYNRINQFKKLAANLLDDSVKKRQDLQNLSNTLKTKMDKIVEIQILMKVDKEYISSKKEELNEINASNIRKKDIINEKLDNINPLLEDSKKKISQISKNHLAEIKTMIKPPEIIKFVVEVVYIMLEDKSTGGLTWSNLIQYVRKDDFIGKVMNFTNIKSIDKLENILMHKRNESYKAHKASKACGILYDWVIANYEYSKVLTEVEPLKKEIEVLEDKISQITKLINIEESKISDLEKSMVEKKEEYTELTEKLEVTKKELDCIDQKQQEINHTLKKILEEVHNWKLEEKERPIHAMIKSKRWFFQHKKNVFICKNQPITQKILESGMRMDDFICTSTRNKNFYQVIQNIYKYNTNIIIKDVDEFNAEIYKLLKFQITNGQFMVILISNFNVNHFREITYTYEIQESFEIEEDVNIKEYEEELLRSIVYFEDMKKISSVKDKLDDVRNKNKLLSKKKKFYNELNHIYDDLNKQYKELLNIELSFSVFKDYLRSKIRLGERDQSKELEHEHFVLSKKKKENVYNHFVVGSLDVNIQDEVCNYSYDITIITEAEEIIYSIENKIDIYESISAGSDENNTKIYNILSEDSRRIYLIKNIHLLKKTIKTGICRCIYTAEKNTNNPLIENSRIIFFETIFDYDRLKKIYLNIFENNQEEIEYHCNFLEKLKNKSLDKKYEIRFKNLSLFIKGKEFCNEEYLKEIIYFNKIDEEDMKELR